MRLNKMIKQPYWGLTQQRGPWKETRQDLKNLSNKDVVWRGGGVGAGGTTHAGHGNWFQEMNPKSASSDQPEKGLPTPSAWSLPSVVIGSFKDTGTIKNRGVKGRKRTSVPYASRVNTASDTSGIRPSFANVPPPPPNPKQEVKTEVKNEVKQEQGDPAQAPPPPSAFVPPAMPEMTAGLGTTNSIHGGPNRQPGFEHGAEEAVQEMQNSSSSTRSSMSDIIMTEAEKNMIDNLSKAFSDYHASIGDSGSPMSTDLSEHLDRLSEGISPTVSNHSLDVQAEAAMDAYLGQEQTWLSDTLKIAAQAQNQMMIDPHDEIIPYTNNQYPDQGALVPIPHTDGALTTVHGFDAWNAQYGNVVVQRPGSGSTRSSMSGIMTQNYKRPFVASSNTTQSRGTTIRPHVKRAVREEIHKKFAEAEAHLDGTGFTGPEAPTTKKVKIDISFHTGPAPESLKEQAKPKNYTEEDIDNLRDRFHAFKQKYQKVKERHAHAKANGEKHTETVSKHNLDKATKVLNELHKEFKRVVLKKKK